MVLDLQVVRILPGRLRHLKTKLDDNRVALVVEARVSTAAIAAASANSQRERIYARRAKRPDLTLRALPTCSSTST